MEWVLAFLPVGLQILAGRLIARDKDSVGADDALGQVLINISPIVPELIQGRTPNQNASDRVFVAIHAASESYLLQRGLIKGDIDINVSSTK